MVKCLTEPLEEGATSEVEYPDSLCCTEIKAIVDESVINYWLLIIVTFMLTQETFL